MALKSRKNRRIGLLFFSLLFFAVSVYIALFVFKENATLYMTPTEVFQGKAYGKKFIRVGGLVEKGSLHFLDDNNTVEFIITDMNNTLTVRYGGIIPNLFVEGSGTVATGFLQEDGVFFATELLAKHDENYMPPEVAKSLNILG